MHLRVSVNDLGILSSLLKYIPSGKYWPSNCTFSCLKLPRAFPLLYCTAWAPATLWLHPQLKRSLIFNGAMWPFFPLQMKWHMLTQRKTKPHHDRLWVQKAVKTQRALSVLCTGFSQVHPHRKAEPELRWSLGVATYQHIIISQLLVAWIWKIILLFSSYIF